MKKKTVIVIVAVMVGVLIFLVMSMFHSAKTMSRRDFADSTVHHLAFWVESYREDFGGHYPHSLDEVASKFAEEGMHMDDERQGLLKAGMKIEYQAGTNGFTLVVTGIDSWSAKWDRLETRFQIGEAVRQFQSKAKNEYYVRFANRISVVI